MRPKLQSGLFLLLLFVRCDTTEPPQNNIVFALTLEDVSCTEAWITLKSSNIQIPNAITLKQNGQARMIINLTTADTLLYIDSLLPKQTYTFQVSSIQHPVSSNKATATTLDTTSHNFTWQTWTFGEHSSSVLYDVAIINENNIWAVGEIYMNDSLGQPDTTPFNAVHWNGISWEIMRIPTKTFSGTIVSSQIKTIFAFNDNNVWMFSIAGSYSHWNGSDWETEFVNERIGSGNKLWGTSSSNLYLVCTNGGISYYNGSSWTKIESPVGTGGTTVDLLDIWGSPDGSIAWSCGYSSNYSTSALIKFRNNVAETVFEGFSISLSNGYHIGPISGVWTNNNYQVFMMNWGGIFSLQNKTQFFLDKELVHFSDVGFGIDGVSSNSLFFCGEGFIGHWNGYTYKEYPEIFITGRLLRDIKINTNTVCAVGIDNKSPIYSTAIIVLGK